MIWQCFGLLFSLGLMTELLGLPWICALRHSMLGNAKHIFKFPETGIPKIPDKGSS